MTESIMSYEEKEFFKNCIKSFNDNENKIVEYIAWGMTDKEIAKKLFLSNGTVRQYVSSILNKTGLKNRVVLAVSYMEIREE